jgi:hypothetical protein
MLPCEGTEQWKVAPHVIGVSMLLFVSGFGPHHPYKSQRHWASEAQLQWNQSQNIILSRVRMEGLTRRQACQRSYARASQSAIQDHSYP